MKTIPRTIDGWRSASLQDPEATAHALASEIEALSPELRRAVFAAVPSRAELAEAFATSASKRPLALTGVPYLLKDLFDFPRYPTTASSTFLSETRGMPREEALISKAIRAKGAVFAGKTQLVEFAYGLSGENPHYGNCPHPVFPDRLSGGSSSGSAWAVQRGIVPIAFGTDTGGSIRVPAAWCGIFGIRLAPNAWSTKGCFPLARSFDTAGWFCKNAEDMAATIEVLIDPRPSPSRPLRGLNLIPAIPNLPDEFRSLSSNILEILGAVADKSAADAFVVANQSIARRYSILQSRDALEVHREWLEPYKDQYDPSVWHRIERALRWSTDDIEDAKQGEMAIKAFFASSFRKYDYVALPATQSPAITAAEHTDPFRNGLLSLNAPGSFARCPALTIPTHLASGESMGIQILYKEQSSDIPLRALRDLASSRQKSPPEGSP